MPIWVRFCFGNWFWIPDPLLSEVHFFSCLWLESEEYLLERCLSESCWFCPSWKPTEVRAVRSQHDRQAWNVGCTCLPRSSLTERSWVLPPCTFLSSDRESPEWNSYSLSGTVTSLFPFLTMHMEAKCSPVPPSLAEWSTQTLQPVNQSLFSNLCPRQNISITIIVDHSL